MDRMYSTCQVISNVLALTILPFLMMEFEIDQIPKNGLDFSVSEDAVQFQINQEDCFLEQPIVLKGELRPLDKEIYFRGEVKAQVCLTCSRCLVTFEFFLKTDVFARFIPMPLVKKHEMERQTLDEEIDAEFYKDSKINLTSSVRDAILLDLPMIRLCKQDCNGLCSECGQNLNELHCKCGENMAIDPRFEKLKQLKEKLQHKETS